MTATNHALTGAAIALALHGSWVAVPLALASHFVLDALPHYGQGDGKLLIMSNAFRNLLIVDGLLATILAASIALAHPAHWWIVDLSAFAATSPDLMWAPRFWRARRGLPEKPRRSLLMKFHDRIQWYQQPRGAIIEAVWLFAFGAIVVNFALKG